MTYQFFLNPRCTPQTQPIPGRAAEMTQGKGGGYAFKADLWQSLRRCLLIGTAKSTFYAGKQELSEDFVAILEQAIRENPERVAAEIALASDGRAINNSAPIFALVILSMGNSPAAKQAFQNTFPKVVRTASHFYEWISYSKSMRGFGKIVRTAGQNWLSRDAKMLAYQLLKYQQRQGFSNRDALWLFHARPISADHDALFKWVLNGWDNLPEQPPSEALTQIWWYEWLKRHPTQTHQAIAQGRLTHEMAAPVGQMDQQTWQLLFNEMPIGALLRNLGSLTALGILRADAGQNLERVEALLNSRRALRQARIHPIDLLKALKTYQSNGTLGRSQKSWTAVPRLVDILEKALELSFQTLKPTGKVFLHAVDVSSSMSHYTVGSIGLSCCEIAATMALATAKAEKTYVIRGFADSFRDLKITARDSFSAAIKKASSQNFGGTDASVAYDWAIKTKFKADVFCFWTDCESWAGRQHPAQVLAEYRRQVNPQAKAVYVTLVPNELSLADPQDANSWDVAGFDPGTPRLIQMLAAGEI